ncbi:hypothetical protein MP228_011575 [Amoeboaphelidium protococcarum]|nr:hypothetical protein MP228_011575 [Amoeboaphelidium protococcarum]
MEENMPRYHSYNWPDSDHIWHYEHEWAMEVGLRRYGMHQNKYELMLADPELEVLQQMVRVGRQMDEMGGFIFAATSVEEYIHDCYYPRQMAEEYEVFAAEAQLATALPLDVANGERLPSPLPWRPPTPFPTLSEIQEYMQDNDNYLTKLDGNYAGLNGSSSSYVS